MSALRPGLKLRSFARLPAARTITTTAPLRAAQPYFSNEPSGPTVSSAIPGPNSKKAAAAIARGEAAQDPFMRVRTLAKTHHDANGASSATPPKPEVLVDSRDGTPTTGPDTPGKATPKRSDTPAQKKPIKGGIAGIRHRNMDDENIAALDLDLDIEI